MKFKRTAITHIDAYHVRRRTVRSSTEWQLKPAITVIINSIVDVFLSRRRVASVFLFFCRNVNMKSII